MLFQSTESRPFSSQSSFRLKFPNWFLFSIHHIACSYLEFVNERWVVQVKTQSYSIFFCQQQSKSVSIIFLVVYMNSRTKRYIYSLFLSKKTLYLFNIGLLWHLSERVKKSCVGKAIIASRIEYLLFNHCCCCCCICLYMCMESSFYVNLLGLP